MKIQILLTLAMLFSFSFEAKAVTSISTESVIEVTSQQNTTFISKIGANISNTIKSVQAFFVDKPKSQVVTLLLCFFVGYIGIHRFYLGYTNIGILQILTFGGLGIWTLIDFIRIVTGDLKPKDGSEYVQTI